MLNKDGQRELAYIVQVDDIQPIEGSDNCECAVVGGWHAMVRKGAFKVGDFGVFFEIDSKLPQRPEFAFLAKRKYKIKTQKFTFGGRGNFVSQGLLMAFKDFEDELGNVPAWLASFSAAQLAVAGNPDKDWKDFRFVTKDIGVTYSVQEDNKRKAEKDKYRSMYDRHKKLFRHQPYKYLYSTDWGKKLLFLFFGKKKDNKKRFPTHFEYIHKTDQERVENMTWVLEDKTPFIVTEKCDGSSATYILERKGKKKFEFYVCSRNVRMLNDTQENYHTTSKGELNVYWEMAKEYDIEEKLRDILETNTSLKYVCWQGELCGPKIQGNPHQLGENHLFLFHMIDSERGMYELSLSKAVWNTYGMESVPILGTTILPDEIEEFKKQADGNYSPQVCGKGKTCAREGFVYYKTDDPNFSFKNVSREYLIKKGE